MISEGSFRAEPAWSEPISQGGLPAGSIASIRREVVVVGAGPAGALAALRMARAGLAVTLVDRADFPRDKVCGCCLNLAAVEALRVVGLEELLGRCGAVPLSRWIARSAGRQIGCSLPGGWALSRRTLDQELIDAARRAGVAVFTGTRASVVAVDERGVTITLQPRGGEALSVIARTAILATGVGGGGVERWLPWICPPQGPFGAGVTLPAPPGDHPSGDYPPGAIFMACGREGYVGLVRLEDGRLDVAAALHGSPALNGSPARHEAPIETEDRDGQAPSGRGKAAAGVARTMAHLLQEAGFPAIEGLEATLPRTTPRLRRRRRAGHGPLIAIGDAARYVEPFTGEGMAWAMRSGLAAAELVIASRNCPPAALGRRWESLQRRRGGGGQIPCRWLGWTLERAATRSLFFVTLSYGPFLARPVLHLLNRAGRGPWAEASGSRDG